jgi:putative ABC transport system permease protein
MNFINPIKISYKYLLAAKFRSFLTILGIIIGVASVIIIMAIGQSVQALILDQVSGVGSNLIGILPGGSDEEGPPAAVMGIITTTFKYEDLLALTNGRNVPGIESGAGYVLGTEKASYGKNSLTVSFTGTTEGYLSVENTEVESGKFFSKLQETDLSRVAVVGANLAKDLFEEEDPIGKSIKIKNHNFLVIGILKKRGSAAFGISSQDDTVFVPLKTAQKLLLGIDHLGFARLKAKNTELIPEAIANIKFTLRERHRIDNPVNDDFSVRDQAQALDMIKNVTNILRYFLLAIGMISLIVGGIGIMNIMLIAVNQRIREVGLRKAVGAKNSDVKTQFLIESVFTSFLGGSIGIIIGILLSFIIYLVAGYLGYDWPFLISWQSIVAAALVSIAIGIIFGYYPAHKASSISPMEALRYE